MALRLFRLDHDNYVAQLQLYYNYITHVHRSIVLFNSIACENVCKRLSAVESGHVQTTKVWATG